MKQRSQRLKPRLFIEALSFIACFFILTYPLTAAAVQPQVAAGFRHTVGLKSDGTVVAVGNNDYDQLNVGAWSDIKQVAAGTSHTVGLKSDGTVAGYGQLFSYIIDSSSDHKM